MESRESRWHTVSSGLAEAEAAGEQDPHFSTYTVSSPKRCPAVWDHRAEPSHQRPSSMPDMGTMPGRTWRSRTLYSSAPTGCIGGLPKTVSKEQVICTLRLGCFLLSKNPGTAHRRIHSCRSCLLEQEGKAYVSGNTAAQQTHNCY